MVTNFGSNAMGLPAGTFPYRWPAVAHITPFTYRDGVTYLELLEEYRQYLINLTPQFDNLLDDIVKALEAAIANAEKWAEDHYNEFTQHINDLVAEINNRVGPTDVKHFTAEGNTPLPFSDLWPNNHIIWYEVTLGFQPNIVLPSNVKGALPLSGDEGSIQRFALWPDGEGNFTILTADQVMARVFTENGSFRNALDSTYLRNDTQRFGFSTSRVLKDGGTQHRYNAWPHVAGVGGSSYVVGYGSGLTHGNGENPRSVSFSLTDNNGATFSRVGEYQVGNLDTGINSLMRLSDGRLMAVFYVTAVGVYNPVPDYYQIAVSGNNGGSWTVVKDKWVLSPQPALFMNSIQLDDGTIVIPYGMNGELGVYTSKNMETWIKHTVPKDSTSSISIEPNIWGYGNTILMLCRTTAGPMTFTYSLDGGVTWADVRYNNYLTQKNTNGTIFGVPERLVIAVPNRETFMIETYQTTMSDFISGNFGDDVTVADVNYTTNQYDYGYLTAATNNGIDYLTSFYGGAPGREDIWVMASSPRLNALAALNNSSKYAQYTYEAQAPYSGTLVIRVDDDLNAHATYDLTVPGDGIPDDVIDAFITEPRVSPRDWVEIVAPGSDSGSQVMIYFTRATSDLAVMPTFRVRRAYGTNRVQNHIGGQFSYRAWGGENNS